MGFPTITFAAWEAKTYHDGLTGMINAENTKDGVLNGLKCFGVGAVDAVVTTCTVLGAAGLATAAVRGICEGLKGDESY